MAPAQSAERDVDSEFALHKQAIKLAHNRKLADIVTDINAVDMTHEDDDDQGERMINEGMEK